MPLSFFFFKSLSVSVMDQVFHKKVMQRSQRTTLGILRYFGKTEVSTVGVS